MICILIKMLKTDLKFYEYSSETNDLYEADYDTILAQLQSEMAG